MLIYDLVDNWSPFNEYFDDIYNCDIPSLPHQIQLFEYLGLIIIFYGKEKLVLG
jgi:hypothetical protein